MRLVCSLSINEQMDDLHESDGPAQEACLELDPKGYTMNQKNTYNGVRIIVVMKKCNKRLYICIYNDVVQN